MAANMGGTRPCAAASHFEVEKFVKEVLRRTPRHSQGCHERLRIAALVGQPMTSFALFRLRLGRLLHTSAAESMILLLVTLELLTSFIEAGVESRFLCLFSQEAPDLVHGFACEGAHAERTAAVLEAFGSLSCVIVCVFALEMVLKIMVAPFQMLGNPWHLLDLGVVCMNVAFTLFSQQTAHMAFAVRWWRIIRFLKLIEEEAVLVEERIRKRFEREIGSTSDAHPADGPRNNPSDAAATSSPGQAKGAALTSTPPLERGMIIGSGVGVVCGTVIGAAVGVLPALFTFGLSIPIFAVGGGGTGLFVGGATGLAGAWATQRVKAD
ncbi:unnamed protein product [Symbiodinium natans]|uniref:Ion transport domain-containing protein n=1 Tax=Symbiodinium natans TaxID=878477 RepID=A0A812SW37_9DINO|nr:unnamed protein product [Symbiodinium natans]